MSLQGKTLFITRASRGIGLAIGPRAARDGANGAVAIKTAEPHPKLSGTSDAAHAIFHKPSRAFTGQFVIDDSFVHEEGARDFEKYRIDPTMPLMPDVFAPESIPTPPEVKIG